MEHYIAFDNVCTRPLLPWGCRSSDGGSTWTHAETLAPPADKSARIIPFGDVVQLKDGTLGVCIDNWQPPDEHNCYFYSSAAPGVHERYHMGTAEWALEVAAV
jgi:hypothetical protein